MSMKLNELSSIMLEANKSAVKQSAQRRAGSILNDRMISIVRPKLPLMVRSYAKTEVGRFVMANLFAAAIVKFGYTNSKLVLASEAMVNDAADQLLGSFDFEAMINEFLDGIDLGEATDTARTTAATGLRKASDIVDPNEKTA